MKSYEVRITTQAQEHILSYARYMKEELLNITAAKKYVEAIGKKLETLNDMPERYPLLDEEPWKSRSIHKMVYKRHLIYYVINEEKHEVNVIAVILEKRDQIKQLEQIEELEERRIKP